MRLFVTVIGSLVLLGLFVFGLALFLAWLEKRKWNRMSIGERLEWYAKEVNREK